MNKQFIRSADEDFGVGLLAGRLKAELKAGKKVLWIIPGGSNLPIAVKAMDMVRNDAEAKLGLLTVSLTDERYGEVGHTDSNWQQLLDRGFDLEGINYAPILDGSDPASVAVGFGSKISALYEDADIVIGQFGIGPDGHIAGILPHSPAVGATEPVVVYEAGPFTRITQTPAILKKIDCAFVFVFGEAKRDAMTKLQGGKMPIEDLPCSLVLGLPEYYIFSDQVS